MSPSGSSPNISVNGTCVANAVRTSSQPSFLYALCDSNGDWTAGAMCFVSVRQVINGLCHSTCVKVGISTVSYIITL